MRWIIINILILNFAVPIFAAGYTEKPINARVAGLSCSGTTVDNNIIAVLANPAGLAFSDGVSVAADYSQKFGIAPLGNNTLTFALCQPAGVILPVLNNWGLSGSIFGYESYRELSVSFAQGFKLVPNFAVGYRLRYLGIRIESETQTGSILLDPGVSVRILP